MFSVVLWNDNVEVSSVDLAFDVAECAEKPLELEEAMDARFHY
jgi:hypothetical protein